MVKRERKGHSIDRRLVAVSRLFYEKQLSKTEIADQLNISITHVNRLLKEASRQGVVQITIQAPRFETLEFALREKYGLLEAVVIPFVDDEHALRQELGIAAAGYFQKVVREGSTVGLGSGRTLFDMVTALPEKPRRLQLFPLAVFAEQDLRVKGIDANTVVNILWFKSRPEAVASRLEIFFPDESSAEIEAKVLELLRKQSVESLRARILDLDYYFFSCSQLREDSQLTSLIKLVDKSSHALTRNGAIGDILFSPIDEAGGYVQSGVENLIFRMDLESLQRGSRDLQKTVVLIAVGEAKVNVIRAVLNTKVFNALVTDNQTAQLIL